MNPTDTVHSINPTLGRTPDLEEANTSSNYPHLSLDGEEMRLAQLRLTALCQLRKLLIGESNNNRDPIFRYLLPPYDTFVNSDGFIEQHTIEQYRACNPLPHAQPSQSSCPDLTGYAYPPPWIPHLFHDSPYGYPTPAPPHCYAFSPPYQPPRMVDADPYGYMYAPLPPWASGGPPTWPRQAMPRAHGYAAYNGPSGGFGVRHGTYQAPANY